jgi:hypothetical protein
MALPAPGIWSAVMHSLFFTTRKTAAGDDQKKLRILFKLVTPPTPAGAGDVGKMIHWDGSYDKGKGTMFVGKALVALGWDGTTDVLKAKLPNTVHVTIEHRQYEDPTTKEMKTTAEIKYVNPIDGSGTGFQVDKNKMNDDEAALASKEFSEMFGALSAAEGFVVPTKGATGNSAPATTAVKPPDPGNDIPF